MSAIKFVMLFNEILCRARFNAVVVHSSMKHLIMSLGWPDRVFIPQTSVYSGFRMYLNWRNIKVVTGVAIIRRKPLLLIFSGILIDDIILLPSEVIFLKPPEVEYYVAYQSLTNRDYEKLYMNPYILMKDDWSLKLCVYHTRVVSSAIIMPQRNSLNSTCMALLRWK